jgi:uncharacterized protein (DUF983 family)
VWRARWGHNEPVALSTSTLLKRGMVRHCPVCDQGHLFRHWVQMVPACPRCGLLFRRLPGHWLGSWFLNICLAQTAIVLVLVVGVATTYPDTPMGVLAALTALVAVAVPFVFFPFSRTIWSAVDLAMRPLDFDDGVAPGFELEADPGASTGRLGP